MTDNSQSNVWPPIVKLPYSELFKNSSGVVTIKCRGTNKMDLLFKAEDVAVNFNFQLNKKLISDIAEYVKIFKSKHKNHIYLTFAGLVHILFYHKNEDTLVFQRNFINHCFTIQMGSIADKEKLCENLLSINHNLFKLKHNLSHHNYACIYLFEVIDVKCDNAKISDISSRLIVEGKRLYRYGCASDISKYVNADADYKNIIVKFSIICKINILLLDEALKDIETMFELINICTETQYVGLTHEELTQIEPLYETISKKYNNDDPELTKKCVRLLRDLKEKDLEIEQLKQVGSAAASLYCKGTALACSDNISNTNAALAEPDTANI
jgi:hypothetical protein